MGGAAAGFFGGFLGGLRDFLVRGSVVDLAVAVVVGTAFTNLVNAVVSDWLTPTLAIWFDPETSFANLTFTARGSVFPWGHFVNTLLTFVLIMLIVFFLVVTPTNALMHATDHKTRMRDCPECLSEIPQRARRCKFCCAAVEPTAFSKQASRAMSRQQGMSPPQVVVVATTAPTSPEAEGGKPIPRAVSLPASVSYARMPSSGKNRVAPLRSLEPIASVTDLACMTSSAAPSADGGGGGAAAAPQPAPQPVVPRVESGTWSAVYQPPPPPAPGVDSLTAVEQSAGPAVEKSASSAVERSAGSVGSTRGAARDGGNTASARAVSWHRMPTGITAASDGL
ncbi:large conductance mechanosensitive channel [Micractinium conductrix]|uniref:Large conductance mechanosensitive channel n=1 Tax=Micractinium conductrix TaxID=554055 RepID=A0A2P6VLL7_9CHLO|nr:large conductance mechanosensitive channel [Micractinium conductrix]|eukprot:PSC74947.1 large conductance mechanosensitive channel [Micractinium conductrix]